MYLFYYYFLKAGQQKEPRGCGLVMEVWDPGPASAVSLILSQDDEHDDDAGGDDDQDDVASDNELLLMTVVKYDALSLLKTTILRTIEELKLKRVSLNRRYIYTYI